MAPRKRRSTKSSRNDRPRKRRAGGGVSAAFRRWFVAALLWCFAGGVLLLSYLVYDLPNADQVRPLERRPSITILAADGSTITRYGGMKGNLLTLADLPAHLPQAVLAVEDRRFYNHMGLDPRGLARAMWANIRARRWVQGGSTITQQLAKNLFLTPEKTLRRKAQEALLALRIERAYSKDEIFAAYLNRVYFGAGAYGIDAGSRTYFGKPASDLTLWESAVLAGLLKAPSRYSPAANPALANARAQTVVRAMQEAGYISKAQEAREIKNARLQVAAGGGENGGLNKYFGDWVLDQIDSFVANNDRDLIVRTTLDPTLQGLAEEKTTAFFKTVKPEDKITQTAVVTVAADGAVLAMVGGVDYKASQFNRATQAMRQPGSAFKPFVFLAALESGFHADDRVLDAPLAAGSYQPKNYEDKYHGDVTLTQALAFSLNTATIRVLQQIGVARLLDVARRLGFTQTFKAELATGLGAGETNLLELTNAYAMIANGGHAIWPYAVLSIEDANGIVIYRHEQTAHVRMFSPHDLRALDGMLVQAVAQGTGQAAQLSRGHVAGKTGTSQNYRDAWFIGYTDALITGVWMGNDDNSPMHRISGGRYPARLWREYMETAIAAPISRPAPVFSRAPTGSGDEGGFSALIRRWTTGSSPADNFSRRHGIKGRDEPVYNR